MTTMTRRAALAGATAIATTAALPALAAATIAGDDTELWALLNAFDAIQADLDAAEGAHLEEVTTVSGYPSIRLLHPKVLAKLSRSDRKERKEPHGPEYETADRLLDRCDRLQAASDAQEARIAETPAVTLAGVLAKLRLFENHRVGRAMLESAMGDLERLVLA